MKDFLAMGGHAEWVWSAFGLATIVLAYNFVAARRRHRRALTRLASLAARAERREWT